MFNPTYCIVANYGPGVYFFLVNFHSGHQMRPVTVSDRQLLFETSCAIYNQCMMPMMNSNGS